MARSNTITENKVALQTLKGVFGRISVKEPMTLSRGKVIEPFDVEYSIYGDLSHPVVVVLGGITANRFVIEGPNQLSRQANSEQSKGWWSELTGAEKAIDTNKYCVVSFDYISVVRVETAFEQNLPHSLTPAEQAKVLKVLLEALGFTESITVVGSSYGGMVGLSFAELYPKNIKHLVCISASDSSTHTARAIRSIQKGIFALANNSKQEKDALSLARQLSIIFYRTDEIFNIQFVDPAQKTCSEIAEQDQTIYSYLNHQGQKFANTTSISDYAALLDSIDNHTVKIEKIECQCSFIAVPNDRLVSYESMRKLAHNVGEKAQFYRLESIYGHDAFLKEYQYLTDLLSKVLGESDEPSSSYASR